MSLGRNTAMSPTVGTSYPINEDANATTVRKNFNICLTTTSSTNVTTCSSYVWNTATYNASGTYTYTTTNAAGCDSVATLHLIITPNVTPAVSIASSAGNSVCSGASTTFTATPTNGGTTPSYVWKLNGNTVGNNSATYTTSSLNNNDVVSCILTSNLACASPITATSNNITITIITTPSQPSNFTTRLNTFVYEGQAGVSYSVANTAGVTYNWLYSGTGATINGSGNSVTVDYAVGATSGNLSVTANNTCGASTLRTAAITVNSPISIPAANLDYSFVTLGCNRVDYLDTTFSTTDPNYAAGKSTANVYQLNRVFTEISHLSPLPKYLVMTGDIVMGYKGVADTAELSRQLIAWRAIYESHPLSSMPITLIAIPGNHETQNKAAGKTSYIQAEQIFTRVMAPYIHGSNGPGVGGPDGLTTDQSKLTYSFNNGGDHFIVINTDPVGKDGITPYKWIAADIQAARANHARHIFAFGHKPAYSSAFTPAGGLDAASTIAQRDSLWKYLENNNCEAMFAAHEHLWDTIHPHIGKTWQVINGNGGTRVETTWTGAGKQYYGYTLVNLYNNRTVNVMSLGRNTAMSPTVGTSYPINEDANATTVRKNFNICLTTTSSTNIVACGSYVWNATTYNTSGNYTYTTTNSAGCDSVATLHLTITPNVTPAVTVTPSPNDTVCAGTSVTFTAAPANGGTTPSYVWKLNGAIVGTNSATYTSSALTNRDTVVCTLSSNATCASPANVSSSIIMTVKAIPTPAITGTLHYCAGASTTLDAGATYTSYLWSNNATTQTISSATAGAYSVTVSNGFCTGTSSSATVVMDTIPAQPATFSTSSSSVNAGQTNVTYTVPNDVNATSYAWTYSGTGATINGSGNSITIDFAFNASNGNLSVTATNNCGTSSPRTMAISVSGPSVFTAGRLAVIQTSGPSAKGGSPVTIKEYATDGTGGISITLPSTGSTPIQMAAGSGGSEGFLSKSADGSALLLAGYSTSATGIVDITLTSAASTPRIIYKLDNTGTYSQVASSSTFYSANDIRGAISDGTNYWASGASTAGVDGIDYFGPGTQTPLAVNTKAYSLHIFNGQIYFSTQKVVVGSTPSIGIYSLGSGMPTSGTITPTLEINTGAATPEDFSINSTGDVCYIAINLNTPAGGIQKWTKTAGTWSLQYTLGTGVANIGAYGLAVDYSGANPILYATTNEANTVGNRIIKITDIGAASAATTLVTGSANTWYHGMSFTPTCSMPVQPSAFTTSSATVNPGQSSVVYTIPNDAAATSYTWAYSGTGAAISGSGNSVTVNFSNAVTAGILSVTANNACGSSAPRSMNIGINGAIRITEYMYSGTNGEFVEFTNIGGTDVDLTGWSWDDNNRTPGVHDLSPIGILKAGESAISTEAVAATFRSAWNLCAGIKIVGGYTADGLGRTDEINLYNGLTLIDRLTFNDLVVDGGPRTQNKSAYVSLAGLGNNQPAQWTLSAVSDVESSFTSAGADIASPGKSTRATIVMDPCFVANGAPIIALNTATTTNYLDGGVASVISPYGISGVVGDLTDPARNFGINFTIGDNETDVNALTVTATSSNANVVPNANITLTGSGVNRNVKINSVDAGYANITVTVNDGTNNSIFVIAFASSIANASAPEATTWHTGMSDASDAIAIDSSYYISGDDELNQLNVYSRYNSGLPLVIYDFSSQLALPNPSKPEVDLEAATRSFVNPNKLFWLGSMSNGKAPFDNKPNRNRLFATTVTGTGAATAFTFSGYCDLKNQILAWGDANGYDFTASAAAGHDSKSIDGFAAESMVFGPDSTTLYIGMRAPMVPTGTRNKAVIVPIINFETWFNNGATSGNPTFGAPIELNLGGNGFRDLIRLSNGTYIIVSGGSAYDGNSVLYKWTGYAIDAPVAISSSMNGAINMEGAMQIGSSLNQIQIICDGGDDILYNDATGAKDFANLNLRKFHSNVLNDVNLNICTGFDASNVINGATTFCAGDSVSLSANINNSSYLWSNGKTAQSITLKRSGSFNVAISNVRSKCSATSTMTNVTVNLMADINRNKLVNIDDFLLFVGKFGTSCNDCAEDINGDGLVNINDFLTFVAQYNQICH